MSNEGMPNQSERWRAASSVDQATPFAMDNLQESVSRHLLRLVGGSSVGRRTSVVPGRVADDPRYRRALKSECRFDITDGRCQKPEHRARHQESHRATSQMQ